MKIKFETNQMVLVLDKNALRKYTDFSDPLILLENELVVENRIVVALVSKNNLIRVSIPFGRHLYYEKRNFELTENLVAVKDLNLLESKDNDVGLNMLLANTLSKILYDEYQIISTKNINANGIETIVYFDCGGYRRIIGVLSKVGSRMELTVTDGIEVEQVIKLSTIVSFFSNISMKRTNHKFIYLEK